MRATRVIWSPTRYSPRRQAEEKFVFLFRFDEPGISRQVKKRFLFLLFWQRFDPSGEISIEILLVQRLNVFPPAINNVF